MIDPALYFRRDCPSQSLLDYAQQTTGIPLPAQMFVRYEVEALPSLTDSKDIQI